jgi:MFS family permease
MGFTSYVTVIPLFISTLTDSSVLIGLIAAMHMIGWQLPQLLTSNLVSRLRRYKPLVLLMTLNERVPFFVLALVALAIPSIGKNAALILALLVVTWQAMGGGLTGTAWQTMIAKIMPPELRGTFYGAQSSAANLLSSGGAVLGGLILSNIAAPGNFALCFLITGICMSISLAFLASAREPEGPPAQEVRRSSREFRSALMQILRTDAGFRLFLGARWLAQIAAVGSAFFTVFAVREFNMDAGTAGVMTGVLMIAQTIANPVFGLLGDRYSHRLMFAVGILMAGASAAIAMAAPSLEWFYVVFALTGFAGAGMWTTAMALTVEFGSEADRPAYIGLANTLTAPATVIAPLVGGWMADAISYQVMFGVTAFCGLITAIILYFMPEPRKQMKPVAELLVPASPYVEQP